MAIQFPATSVNLLTKLKEGGDAQWQVSWKRFLELYHTPIEVTARASYRKHTGGQEPSSLFIEEVVANTVAGFFSKGQYGYDSSKGRLRTYLRLLTNARVVDLLRKERPIDHKSIDASSKDTPSELPEESTSETNAYIQSLLATLVEDLRNHIPLRQFEIFERVKLKHQSPQFVAEDLGIKRAMVDRYIYKAMSALRELAKQQDYQDEFYDS